jgi:hypothetical protein
MQNSQREVFDESRRSRTLIDSVRYDLQTQKTVGRKAQGWFYVSKFTPGHRLRTADLQ